MYRNNSDSSFSFSELWQLSKFIDIKGDKYKIRKFFKLQRYSHVLATTIVVVVFGVSVAGLISADLGINLAIPILLVTPWVSGVSLSAFYRLRLSIRRDLGLEAGNQVQSQEKKQIAVFSLNCLSALLLIAFVSLWSLNWVVLCLFWITNILAVHRIRDRPSQ